MKRIIFVLISLFFVQFIFSQEVNITIQAPPKAGVGQRFEIRYSVNQKGSNIKLENNSKFNTINGPSTQTSSSTRIMNGSVTHENTYSYTYVLEAKEIGNFSLPVFSVNVDGKTYSSKTTNIEIQKDPVQAQQNQGNRHSRGWDPWEEMEDAFWGRQTPQQNTQPQEINSEDLFVRMFVNRTDVYKGEPIIATIKVFTAVDLSGIEDIAYPPFNSFYSEITESAQRINFTRETYNNKVYNTFVLRKYILYPRVSGEVTIEPCRLDCNIRQITGSGFWNTYSNTVKKTIYSPEVKINVKNLPLTNLNSFNGAVGNYNIKLETSADTVNVNDAVTFRLSLSGTGNFNMVELPKIQWPDEFEVFDPVVTDKTTVTEAGISGTKTWEYTIVPRYPGLFKLDNINFSYFDLNSKQYKTQTIDNISLAVRKDKNDNKFTEYNYTKKNVEYIGDEDIRFIKTRSLNLKKNYSPLITNWLSGLFYIIPLILFIILVILLRKRIKESSDITKIKAKKANKISQKRLKKAKNFMQHNNKSEFYKEIISALWGYVSDKLSIPVAGLTKSNVENELQKRNIDSNIITDFLSIIDKCEFAHFAPATPETELSYVYQEAVNIIETLEQKIK